MNLNQSLISCMPFNFVDGSLEEIHLFAYLSLRFKDLIQEYLNVELTVVHPRDHEFGLKKSNGSWTGCVGQVKEGFVDLGIGPFTIRGKAASSRFYH